MKKYTTEKPIGTVTWKKIYNESKKALNRIKSWIRKEQLSRKYWIGKHQVMVANMDSGFKNYVYQRLIGSSPVEMPRRIKGMTKGEIILIQKDPQIWTIPQQSITS